MCAELRHPYVVVVPRQCPWVRPSLMAIECDTCVPFRRLGGLDPFGFRHISEIPNPDTFGTTVRLLPHIVRDTMAAHNTIFTFSLSLQWEIAATRKKNSHGLMMVEIQIQQLD